MIVTADFKLSVSATETITIGLGTAPIPSAISYAASLANGTGASAINKVWSKSATAAASTPDTYTLSALVDDAGRTIAFTKVRALVIVNLDTTDGHDLTIGNAATHPWAAPFGAGTQTFTVKASGIEIKAAPLATAFAVTSGSSDQLKVDPGSNSIAYKIWLIGE